MAEEEEMELSGESNLVSNLHNFSFDVSWSSAAREISPPTHRRQAFQVLSPARFTHNAPEKFSTHNALGRHQMETAASPIRGWKSLTLKPMDQSTPTVKVSGKTFSAFHSETPISSNHGNQKQSYSPMELDQSENSFVTDQNIDPGLQKVKKRHSDFGASYSSGRKQESNKSMLVIPEKGKPIRRKTMSNISVVSSGMEDSVFEKPTFDTSVNQSVNESRRSSTGESARKKAPVLFAVAVIVISFGIGCFLYVHVEKCAVFDVDVVKLGHKLEDNVFGQHIAVKTVVESLTEFGKGVREGSAKRHLALSFHGWTGIGKNYVSKFIAEAFYKAKKTLFLVPLHFIDRTENNDGRNLIESWIVSNVSECGVNVIIFDEMDKAELDHLLSVRTAMEIIINKTQARDSNRLGPFVVFLFLSNSRSREINQYLFSQLVNNNRERELIRKSEFDDIFASSTSEWYEDMKYAGLIDYFIPFLPLSESHVKQCIEREFIRKGRDPSSVLIASVMEELSFFDMGGRNGQMSRTGCKRVEDKVNLHMDD